MSQRMKITQSDVVGDEVGVNSEDRSINNQILQ